MAILFPYFRTCVRALRLRFLLERLGTLAVRACNHGLFPLVVHPRFRAGADTKLFRSDRFNHASASLNFLNSMFPPPGCLAKAVASMKSEKMSSPFSDHAAQKYTPPPVPEGAPSVPHGPPPMPGTWLITFSFCLPFAFRPASYCGVRVMGIRVMMVNDQWVMGMSVMGDRAWW